MSSIFSKCLRWLYALLSLPYLIVYLLSALSNYISPQFFASIAPFGLIFFPLYIGLIFVCIFWILKRSKRFVILSLIGLIFGFMIIRKHIQWNGNQQEKGLKVMSWNVKNFDLYNWSQNEKTRSQMLNLIDSINPDIICMQEFYTDLDKMNNLVKIKELGYPYISFQSTVKIKDREWGIATASKFPILKSQRLEKVEKNQTNISFICEIEVKDKIWYVVNSHMQSIHFGYEDYDYLQQLINPKNYDNTKTDNILQKLLKAYPKRVEQIKNMLKSLDQWPKKNTILCCDLNDLPCSYAHHILSNEFDDTFILKGRGIGKTFNMSIPYLKIDHIFVSSDVKVHHHSILKRNLSDHYPIITYLE